MMLHTRTQLRSVASSLFSSFQKPISDTLPVFYLPQLLCFARRSVAQFIAPRSHRFQPNPFSLSSSFRPNLRYRRVMSSNQAAAVQLLKDTPYFYNSSDTLLEALASKCTSLSNVVLMWFLDRLDLPFYPLLAL
jgi:hypothetical protein